MIPVHGGHYANHRTPHGHDASRYGGPHQGCGRRGRLRHDQRSHPRSVGDWKVKRSLKLGELEALRADIDKGMADLSAGRVTDFDMDKIIERGRKLLAGRAPSA